MDYFLNAPQPGMAAPIAACALSFLKASRAPLIEPLLAMSAAPVDLHPHVEFHVARVFRAGEEDRPLFKSLHGQGACAEAQRCEADGVVNSAVPKKTAR